MKLKGKIKVLIADNINQKYISILRSSRFTITRKYGIPNQEILKLSREKQFDVLIIKSRRIIDKNFLACCGFKLLCTASKGTDHIDTSYAEKIGMRIIYSETGNTHSAAEHTFA